MYTFYKPEAEVNKLRVSANSPLTAKEVVITTNGKTAGQSAGPGLSTTKTYLEMYGGRIRAYSMKSIGSALYFTLADNDEPAKETVIQQLAPPDKAEQVRKLKILIAEDDEVSEMLISITLRMFCKEILKVTTGVEAVEKCRENPDIDLVLMDIHMPDLNGYDATRQIRQFNKELVIIAQTAYGQSGDREKAIEVGCNDYIAKPIAIDELHALIYKYFKK
ncbi:MAG: response regulator [Bacteroidales bacterium]|nr:response regulator [Bacteroidales bacterium]